MGEKTGTHEQVSLLLTKVYDLLREGKFEESMAILSEALTLDFEQQEVVSSLKCATFWVDRGKKLETFKDDSEKGEFLLEQWKYFTAFLEKLSSGGDGAIYNIKQFVFKNALESFNNLLHQTGAHDPDILFRIGKCYKGIGDYEKAVNFFEAASHQRMEDPETLSELADCYAFLNEVKAAKVFFREAFYLNPQRIDVSSLESMLIGKLVSRLKEQGYASPELEEWIPVYGVLYGVFNVKRELKPLEYGKLKQSIYSMECNLKEGKDEQFVVPRLINRYFWMIDHIMGNKSERDKLQDFLDRIKKLDAEIYELYIK
ncbi:MAG: tetratricopeptide repeat protein [Spirochaetales bacterium]|nr:MAG: tetratricopeptide repeat protein [Spirochaetales bacterium]